MAILRSEGAPAAGASAAGASAAGGDATAKGTAAKPAERIRKKTRARGHARANAKTYGSGIAPAGSNEAIPDAAGTVTAAAETNTSFEGEGEAQTVESFHVHSSVLAVAGDDSIGTLSIDRAVAHELGRLAQKMLVKDRNASVDDPDTGVLLLSNGAMRVDLNDACNALQLYLGAAVMRRELAAGYSMRYPVAKLKLTLRTTDGTPVPSVTVQMDSKDFHNALDVAGKGIARLKSAQASSPPGNENSLLAVC